MGYWGGPDGYGAGPPAYPPGGICPNVGGPAHSIMIRSC